MCVMLEFMFTFEDVYSRLSTRLEHWCMQMYVMLEIMFTFQDIIFTFFCTRLELLMHANVRYARISVYI